jgi:CHAT domain-containing protein
MNSERTEAYLQLIQSLLNCDRGEEAAILAANQELVDSGLLQLVLATAQMFNEQGNENVANWLKAFANELRNILNQDTEVDLQSLSEEELQGYSKFLMEALEATEESGGDAQVVYPLLQKNIEKLDGVLAEILKRLGTNVLGEAQPDVAEGLAGVIFSFGNRLQQFPLGSKAHNIEIAITSYEIALTIFTQSAFPEKWAMTQNNLGEAYRNRILGDKAQNIETAIAAYIHALSVYTQSAFPVDWAMTQNNLGNAYRNRILGDKAQNIETAIAAFTQALSVRTQSAFPVKWATTQNNLGNAYYDRIQGDKAQNIETAIAAYTQALSVRTQSAFPVDWAGTQNNLGIAYSNRILGDKAQNIETAIAAFTHALSVYTQSAFPVDWAMTQNNLGLAYSDRILGEKAQNIETAIAAYTQALSVYTQSAFPVDWAGTQNNLGLAYSNRILGEKAQNIETAIAAFTQALSVYTQSAFPVDWAGTQNNLGIAYSNRILGEKAQNIETAIAAYTQALSVYTQSAFPVDWAMTQNNLGLAYRNGILGGKAQNIETAIAAFTHALSVRTQSAFPEKWAMTQNNLGLAYSDRILGEKAQNIETAIAAYTQALSVYTQSAFPEKWAMTQNNLGAAYYYRILGEKAQNIETAIAAYTQALSVYTQSAFPVDWARTQNNLGSAYSDRILGDKAQNIEQAIAAYTQALSILTQSAFPVDWAMTQNNLGLAYSDRILGEKAQNIETAIAAYTQALSVYTQSAFPVEWAKTQNNLGLAYSNRILGDFAQNIETAIAAFTQALSVYTQSAFPVDWAITQNNLGVAYRNRILGDKAQNIETAIAAYTQALSVRTQSAFPVDWAMTQNNLGNAYRERILGEKAQNIESAIAAFKQALSVLTQSAFPQEHAKTLFNLGFLYQNAKRFTEAYNTYKSAIATVESLRGEIVSGDESKRKQAEEWNELYRRMVEVCLELEEYTQAVEYIERSKTRNLVELLFTRHNYPNIAIPAESQNQLQQLQQKIELEKHRIEQLKKSNSPEITETQLNQLRQQREQLITRIIGLYPIQYHEIQNLIDNETILIQFYLFNDCFRVFLITSAQDKPLIWHSQLQDLENLENWKDDYLNNYSSDKKRWRYHLDNKLTELSEILHLEEILSLIPPQYEKAILIPHRYLHLLPLHALPIQDGYLIDKFPRGVSYAPSCQLLRFPQNNTTTEFADFFAIQNPTGDLPYTDIEVETIHKAFNPNHILKKSKATVDALKTPPTADYFQLARWLHFSSHGYFNFNEPEKSALQLARSSNPPQDLPNERLLQVSRDVEIDLSNCLTLEDIFLLNLPNCRLVTLSACETGLTDSTSTSDEYIGLPSGFIRAGAASVVSSLWAVNDFSTALLMIKFYDNLQNLTPNVPSALNQAQQWIRQVTQVELLQWLDSIIYIDVQQKQKIQEQLQLNYKPEQQPFKKPYSWAAFCAMGE